jgi:hypothetical protein
VTAIFIFGMVMRPERKLVGLGPDSLVALGAYVVAVSLLGSIPD